MSSYASCRRKSGSGSRNPFGDYEKALSVFPTPIPLENLKVAIGRLGGFRGKAEEGTGKVTASGAYCSRQGKS